MNKLERYDFSEHFQALQPADNGFWVKYEDAKELEAKIAELESDWVSCEDRMPVDYKDCIGFICEEILIVSGGEVYPCEFTCGNKPEPWYRFEEYHKGFVTHWRELPSPPKAKG